jgi:hypothetical protein
VYLDAAGEHQKTAEKWHHAILHIGKNTKANPTTSTNTMDRGPASSPASPLAGEATGGEGERSREDTGDAQGWWKREKKGEEIRASYGHPELQMAPSGKNGAQITCRTKFN